VLACDRCNPLRTSALRILIMLFSSVQLCTSLSQHGTAAKTEQPLTGIAAERQTAYRARQRWQGREGAKLRRVGPAFMHSERSQLLCGNGNGNSNSNSNNSMSRFYGNPHHTGQTTPTLLAVQRKRPSAAVQFCDRLFAVA